MTMMTSNEQATRAQMAKKLLSSSELIHDTVAVTAALDQVAAEITRDLADSNPLMLCVMSGGVPFAGGLLTRLNFPLDFDYLHATRYGENTVGTTLSWRAFPRLPVKDRVVLVVDDILDEGVTLAAIRDRLLQMGAAEVRIAVFANKEKAGDKPVRADYLGLNVPDRFVFGFGMDVQGAWRNLPAVYAVSDPRNLA
jgi:hypoxanthine phosphoribosyltransferase